MQARTDPFVTRRRAMNLVRIAAGTPGDASLGYAKTFGAGAEVRATLLRRTDPEVTRLP